MIDDNVVAARLGGDASRMASGRGVDGETLRVSPLLDGADAFALENLSARMRIDEFEPGDRVYRQGDAAETFGIVMDGLFTVENRHDQGVVLWERSLGPGAVVGVTETRSGADRMATVTCRVGGRMATGDAETLTDMLAIPDVSGRLMRIRSEQLAQRAEPICADLTGAGEIWLRPFLPSDRDELGQAITQVSDRTRRLRFFSGGPVSGRVVDYLANLDYVNHFAWAASQEPHGAGIGIVRIIRDKNDPAVAELAVAITDDHQGRGIGAVLVGAGAASADVAQIHVLKASVLGENRPMRALLDRAGASWTRAEPGVVETQVEVSRLRTLISATLASQLRSVAASTIAAAVVPVNGGDAPSP